MTQNSVLLTLAGALPPHPLHCIVESYCSGLSKKLDDMFFLMCQIMLHYQKVYTECLQSTCVLTWPKDVSTGLRLVERSLLWPTYWAQEIRQSVFFSYVSKKNFISSIQHHHSQLTWNMGSGELRKGKLFGFLSLSTFSGNFS